MRPQSFENGARSSLDLSPFLLAFGPALLLVRRRRGAVLTVAAVGIGYAARASPPRDREQKDDEPRWVNEPYARDDERNPRRTDRTT